MKYLCDACSRLVEASDFSAADGGLVLTCPTCGEPSRLSAAATPPIAAEPARPAKVLSLMEPHRPEPSPAGRCPKCAAPREERREHCVRCGLVFANFKAEEFALPPELEQLWADVARGSSDPAVHTAFVEAATQEGALHEAARRYRLHLEERPVDALARRSRDEVFGRLTALSQIAMEPPSQVPREPSGTVRLLLTLLALAALAISLWALLAIQRTTFGG